MTTNDTPQAPWLKLYQSVPATLEPAPRTGLDMFRRTLEARPDAGICHYFDQTLTAAEINVASDALACAFRARDIHHGDRIAMYLQNIPQVMITVLAAWKCGAVIVPCNPMLRENELAKILRASGCRILVCQEDLYHNVAQAALEHASVEHTITTTPLEFLDPEQGLPRVLGGMARQRAADVPDMLELIAQFAGQQPRPKELDPEDVAFMVYTSGTTGEPKGAMNTHGNVVFATSVYEAWMPISAADVILGLAPLFHVTGLIGHVSLALLTGAPLILFYRFDAREACRLAVRHRATFTVSAVTAFIAMLNDPAMAEFDLSGLAKVYTGGAPTPPNVLEEWYARTGQRIHPMYGLTEATSPTHATPFGVVPPIDPHTGAMAVGVPVPNTHVKVITDSGLEAEPGEIGEFYISGPQIVPGYWQKPEETARTITPDGLRTGDVGFMDAQGWFYLVDRSKDMIVASVIKVWPREVEEVLYSHPAIREAAVVGVPDQYRGETIKAVVSLKPGCTASPEEIRAFTREHLAAYKYPRFVEIMDELPKTTSGKIMRRLLQPTSRDEAMRMEAAESVFATVSYPQLRAAVEARAVLEAGAVWLRLSRGAIPRKAAQDLYDTFDTMLEQLNSDGTFADRDEFLVANKQYHAAVIALAGNEHLNAGFESLKLRQLYRAALKDQTVAVPNVVLFHQHLTDSIAAGDSHGALQAILSWGKNTAVRVRKILEREGEAIGGLRPSGIIEDLAMGFAPDQEDLATDVDALVEALDARAALEIGITQSLGGALSVEAQREALVGRLRAFTPLVRGRGAAQVARYIRSDDAYHRVFLSLLRNRSLFDIYNAMDLPELMRRVLEVAPPSIREVFDDHKALTNALKAGDADAVCAAITAHANQVRQALTDFLAAQKVAAEEAQAGLAAAS